jgi:hypothetical protein
VTAGLGSLVRGDPRGRLVDLAALAVTAVFLGLLVRDLVPLLPNLDPAKIAVDYNLYVDATRRVLSGSSYYLPYQLQGPYDATPGVILYPPTFILVMLPFLVLPWILYWALPIGAVGYAVWRHRPRVVAWPVIAICLWFPGTTVMVVAGNPALLAVGALALGTIWMWPSVLVLLKPTLAPFALFGARRRSWWIALGVLVLASVPFGAMWADYVTVLLNARHPLGLLYNLGQVPTVLLPIVVWAGRRRPVPAPVAPARA